MHALRPPDSETRMVLSFFMGCLPGLVMTVTVRELEHDHVGNSEFSQGKMVIVHSYVSLHEGNRYKYTYTYMYIYIYTYIPLHPLVI